MQRTPRRNFQGLLALGGLALVIVGAGKSLALVIAGLAVIGLAVAGIYASASESRPRD